MIGGHGYLEDAIGNKSSSRLIGVSVVYYALALATLVQVLGFIEGTKVMVAAAASGTIFTTIAGPALIYLFSNKHEEGKQIVEQECVDKTAKSKKIVK